MKIGIVGCGIVGQVLGTGFLNEGHEVMLGSRDKSKKELAQWQGKNPPGKIGTFKEAAAFGELLVLAIAGHVANEAIEMAGKNNFNNKVVIDATNPIAAAAPPE